ncbi:hypothetical protein [Bradyrhizobium septentrionale]|uniref:Heme exporter protein D n=1 Tax=Bradyrhizobium septentrionale TaxID=1404411 RepID=A0ABZ2P5R2_9BRAD
MLRIPAMAAGGYGLGWESYGIWFGLCLGFAVTSLLLGWRFLADLQKVLRPVQTKDEPAEAQRESS